MYLQPALVECIDEILYGLLLAIDVWLQHYGRMPSSAAVDHVEYNLLLVKHQVHFHMLVEAY